MKKIKGIFIKKQEDGIKKSGKRGAKRKKLIAIGLVAAIVLAGAGVAKKMLPTRSEAEEVKNASATAETGSIESTVSATGNLSLGDSTDVVVPTGILVKEILVESGDEVKKGDILAKLDSTSVVSALIEAEETEDDLEDQLDDDDLTSLEEEKIEGELEEIAERISDLEKLHENPVIKASKSGVIASVNISEGSEITQSSSGGSSTDSTDTTTESSVSSTSGGTITATTASYNSGKTITASTLGYRSTTATKAVAMSTDSTVAEEKTTEEKSESTSESTSTEEKAEEGQTEDKRNEEKKETTTESSDKTISDLSSLTITEPVTGATPQSDVSSTDSYTGSISWSPSASKFAAGTAYTATVTLTARDGYVFKGSYAGGTIKNDGKTLVITRTYAATASESSTSDSSGSSKKSSETNTQTNSKTGKSGGSASAMSAGSSSGGSSSSSSSSDTSTTEFYGSYRTAAFGIQTGDSFNITVSIDELDILSIEKGQTAKITLDALEGEEFEGTISKISSTATTSNGSTKYSVEISIDKEENMMDGMSASVEIVTDSIENAVIIPVAALQEKGGKTFVYTSEDEDGNLSGEVEVETGLSNDSNVAVTSGLSEGDTVYYESVDLNSSGEEMMKDMQRMGGGQGGPGGNRPDGGNGGGPGGNGGGQ